MRYLGILFIFLPLSSLAFSATIYVPDNYPTIQGAINAAVNGDTVIVRPGTYVENIDFMGMGITVKSEKGPQVTVIDGNQLSSCVAFVSGEQQDSVIEGFTLTYGSGYNGKGGGVACIGSSPTIKNNIMIYNVPANGGGISCSSGSSPAIIGNVIAYNIGPSAGGGIFLYSNCSPLIANNIIVGNDVASATGGAIYIGYSSDALVINNTIYKNSALSYGAIFSYSSNPVIINTIARKNTPNEFGGSYTASYCNVEGGVSGTGNIDADPLFVDPVNNDFHLTYPSPCKDAGDSSAVTELYDYEGDPRIAFGTVDMGADEFHTHLYWTGDATAGGTVDLKFVGLPGTSPVGLCIGTGVLDPPLKSMWGDWYLKFPILGPINFGMIPSPDGVLVLTGTLPGPAPYSIPMQALIGAELTNLSVMMVE